MENKFIFHPNKYFFKNKVHLQLTLSCKYCPTSKDSILHIEFIMFSSYYAKLRFMYL